MNKSLVLTHSKATKYVNPSGAPLMTTAECNGTTKKKERKGKEDSQVATMPRQATGEMNYYRAHHKFHTPTQKGPADKRGNQLDPRTSPSASILSRSVH